MQLSKQGHLQPHQPKDMQNMQLSIQGHLHSQLVQGYADYSTYADIQVTYNTDQSKDMQNMKLSIQNHLQYKSVQGYAAQ